MKLDAKTGRCPLVLSPGKKWLSFAEAAELLAVTKKTIQRWVSRPATRKALLAVRDGKRWRIPRPENLLLWGIETRARLKDLGMTLKKVWERDLERRAKETGPFIQELRRLYLAASAKALSYKRRITIEAKLGIDRLCNAALEMMRSEKRLFDVESLKRKLPGRLLRYWPMEADFNAIRDTHTREAVETERRRVDFVQAVRIARRRGRAPTAKNLCPSLHQDWLAHVNDTKEKLPPGSIDFRQPQLGISLDQFRRRYPLRKEPWASIIRRTTYGGVAELNEKPDSGRTRFRGPQDDFAIR